MNGWEEKLRAPDIKKARYTEVYGGRYFKLTAKTVQQKIFNDISLSNPLQESNGLIGGFIVLPKLQTDIPNRDYVLLIQLEFISANPGIWPVNGTKPFHKTNNGVSPGGMLTRLIYT